MMVSSCNDGVVVRCLAKYCGLLLPVYSTPVGNKITGTNYLLRFYERRLWLSFFHVRVGRHPSFSNNIYLVM